MSNHRKVKHERCCTQGWSQFASKASMLCKSVLQDNEVVSNPQTSNLGGGPGAGKVGAVAGAMALTATAGGTPSSACDGTPTAGYTGGLAPVGQTGPQKVWRIHFWCRHSPCLTRSCWQAYWTRGSPSFPRGNTPGTHPPTKAVCDCMRTSEIILHC